MRGIWTALLIMVVFLAASCTQPVKLELPSVPLLNPPDPTEAEKEMGIQMTKEGVKYLVHPDKILSGGPPKGGIGVDRGIPAINKPAFISVQEADEWIEDNELVLALQYKGVTRVYPLQILVWHEIVNDVVAGDPLLVSYCPLCGSGIAYERTINGTVHEFGTSGKLYNSDLVMYDSLTDTFWTQIGGLAIIGPLTGTRLVPVSVDTVTWGEWKTVHPDSEVLSKETGFVRAYGNDPYGNYYFEDYLLFPVESKDEKIHPKTVIFGIEINGTFKAYQEDDIKELKNIEDTVAGVPIKITRFDDGTVKIVNARTNGEIIKERDFWFAWYAFHPNTLLFEKKD